jgi:8-oxo-dGTP pyrophosphatase MutT (NUDIX family)
MKKSKKTPGAHAIFAAGGVVFDSRGRVAVIHRPRYDDWCLPKGKLKKNEDSLVAAVREVWEETNCIAAPQKFLGTICYTVKGKPKWVFYWSMLADTIAPFTPNAEVDVMEWLTPKEAMRWLDHRGEIALLKLAIRKR